MIPLWLFKYCYIILEPQNEVAKDGEKISTPKVSKIQKLKSQSSIQKKGKSKNDRLFAIFTNNSRCAHI